MPMSIRINTHHQPYLYSHLCHQSYFRCTDCRSSNQPIWIIVLRCSFFIQGVLLLQFTKWTSRNLYLRNIPICQYLRSILWSRKRGTPHQQSPNKRRIKTYLLSRHYGHTVFIGKCWAIRCCNILRYTCIDAERGGFIRYRLYMLHDSLCMFCGIGPTWSNHDSWPTSYFCCQGNKWIWIRSIYARSFIVRACIIVCNDLSKYCTNNHQDVELW